MPKYRVRGSRTSEFYIDVEAAGPDEAFDIANGDHIFWNPVDIDDPIEPYEVELRENDQRVYLTSDYPEMTSGVIIGGTN